MRLHASKQTCRSGWIVTGFDAHALTLCVGIRFLVLSKAERRKMMRYLYHLTDLLQAGFRELCLVLVPLDAMP
jgi:hypothetical protein